MKAKNMKEFHRLVCERENYICQGCGKDYSSPMYFDENDINQYLAGHHIKTRGSSPELQHDISNGACVCFSCHELTHRGRKNLSPNKS